MKDLLVIRLQSGSFYETQTKEAILLASDLLSGPSQHLRRAAASGTLSVVYDSPTLKSAKEPIVEAISDLASAFFRLLSRVLTRFNFSPGCDTSLAGESPQYIMTQYIG
jgi:hypothetical protein